MLLIVVDAHGDTAAALLSGEQGPHARKHADAGGSAVRRAGDVDAALSQRGGRNGRERHMSVYLTVTDPNTLLVRRLST